jgi:hypothetical protein
MARGSTSEEELEESAEGLVISKDKKQSLNNTAGISSFRI